MFKIKTPIIETVLGVTVNEICCRLTPSLPNMCAFIGQALSFLCTLQHSGPDKEVSSQISVTFYTNILIYDMLKLVHMLDMKRSSYLTYENLFIVQI